MAKIYTKTGDKGETGLIGGKRVPKNHVRVEAYGTIDEANAVLGIILSRYSYFNHYEEIAHVQHLLFDIGAVLANPDTSAHQSFDSEVNHLEQLIDELSEELPPLTHFILPSGTELGAYLHFARTVVRQAERRVITVSQHQDVPEDVIRYLNRLSDYLFVLARAVNHEHGVPEKMWKKREAK